MPLRIAASLQSAQAQKVIDLIDAGSGPGVAKIRTGSQPATPATSPSGTLLATVVLADPCGTESGGVVTFTDPASVNGVADGTAGWVRFEDSDGNAVADGHVTNSAGDGVLRLSNTSITTGNPVDVTDGTWTVPM